MFIHQPRLDTLELKKEKGTDYFLSWISKGLHTSKHESLYTAFLHSIKFSGYKTEIKVDKDPLAREQSNYLPKIFKVFIFYNLDVWPRNPTNNLKFKNCLLGATSTVKNSDKEKCVYSGYEKYVIVQVHGVLIMKLLEML